MANHSPGASNPNWRGGKSSHPLYDIYNDMLGRCSRSTHHHWANYGGRGITVCQRWRDDFWNFVADMGPRPAGMLKTRPLYSLDRRDNDGDYTPENCRWATASEQMKNRRASAYSGLRNRTPRTHCKRNHEFTPENTYRAPGRPRSRSCITCHVERTGKRPIKAAA